jgi:tryptophan synthase beta chain
MGIFYPFKDSKTIELIGVEAGGKGIATGMHAASISAGTVGVLHGNKTYLLQDAHGQVRDAHSIAAGLDYPGVGPEHSYFHATGRVRYVSINDDEAVEAFLALSKLEGIIPAMESAHAVAYAMKLAPTMDPGKIIIINLSGRGDKDAETILERIEVRSCQDA